MLLTQHEKLIILMAREPMRWFKPHELAGNGELFVGYEASARLSELSKYDFIESRRAGKFVERRINLPRLILNVDDIVSPTAKRYVMDEARKNRIFGGSQQLPII